MFENIVSYPYRVHKVLTSDMQHCEKQRRSRHFSNAKRKKMKLQRRTSENQICTYCNILHIYIVILVCRETQVVRYSFCPQQHRSSQQTRNFWKIHLKNFKQQFFEIINSRRVYVQLIVFCYKDCHVDRNKIKDNRILYSSSHAHSSLSPSHWL